MTLAIVCVVSIALTSCRYWIVRSRSVAAYRELMRTKGEPMYAAEERYRLLDRRAMRILYCVLLLYACGYWLLIFCTEGLVGTISFIAVCLLCYGCALVASIYNDREGDIRLSNGKRKLG